jgi:hypothetical protein
MVVVNAYVIFPGRVLHDSAQRHLVHGLFKYQAIDIHQANDQSTLELASRPRCRFGCRSGSACVTILADDNSRCLNGITLIVDLICLCTL